LTLDRRQSERLRASAHALLKHNWREGVHRRAGEYAFTCPATPRYRHQWYWDSCFHAIVWSHFDPPRARRELQTLLKAGRHDGFVPHTAFWDAPAGWRRAPLYATARPVGDLATESIQTPLLAVAWERVAAASADEPEFARRGLAAVERHYDWLAYNRDPDDDGLLTVILPDESGLDDSPKYDEAFGWRAHWKPGYFALVAAARRQGYRAAAITRSGDLHVEDVLVNVAYVLGLEALARMNGENGSGRWSERARATTAALLARCWDDDSALFRDLAGRGERRLTPSTWSSLAPICLGGVPESVRRRVVETHLLHPRRYRAPTGIPSVAMDEPSFVPRFDMWRTWRGPAWMVTAWLLAPAMRELGYERDADRIVASLADAVERDGWREYYNPLTGRGHAARGFAMSTLLVDLLGSAR
jgi:Mannosylglycerate hydrolase MGH1-like glycoside hydrolase domain